MFKHCKNRKHWKIQLLLLKFPPYLPLQVFTYFYLYSIHRLCVCYLPKPNRITSTAYTPPSTIDLTTPESPIHGWPHCSITCNSQILIITLWFCKYSLRMCMCPSTAACSRLYGVHPHPITRHTTRRSNCCRMPHWKRSKCNSRSFWSSSIPTKMHI